jgi:hypothetical protein
MPQSGKQKRIESGATEAGKTAWKAYEDGFEGIFVEINTSDKGFTKTPNYVVSISGDTNHWTLLGTSSVYDPTPKGFRVYLCSGKNKPVTPALANQRNWRVTWIAVEE